jgi:hypothetical protein
MRGTQFNDIIAATDTVGERYFGLGGHDTFQFYSAAAKSRFIGGAGDDSLIGVGVSFLGGRIVPNLQGTVFHGGTGFDRVIYSVNMEDAGAQVKLGKGGLRTSGVEALGFNIDLAVTSDSPASFKISGTAGRDLISVFNTGSGRASALVAEGGRGNDTLELGSNFQAVTSLALRGGVGNDQITVRESQGTDGARLEGGNGNDTIRGDVAHAETILGGNGRDTVILDAAALSVVRPDTIRLGNGRDMLRIEDLDQFSIRHVANVADFRPRHDRIAVAEEFRGKVLFDEMPEAATGFDLIERFLVIDRQEGTLSVVTNSGPDIADGATLVVDFGQGLNLGLRNFTYYDDLG